MEYISVYVMTVVQTGGVFAPLLFITLHLLRPLLFLPVVFLCITGGILFGVIPGIIYSVIGITLSSFVFYKMTKRMPATLDRFIRMKHKLIGDHPNFTTGQIAILRLIPFIHFHLLSLCILEISSHLKDYMRTSFVSNVPLAVVYTSIGRSITNFSPLVAGSIILCILPFLYILRRKEIRIGWQDFFNVKSSNAGI
ncbi:MULTISPECIES: TVP38/TMEM64 family protein [Paraliobacillus]|uniref:TVP38/TMEM64 family protein n=1 Tax=Paraliobacillus TaxID=200903 RepID=UPI000DD4C274|nr:MULTISPECIES: VTT domain-containing protein [Paraliobacillus]